MDFSRVTDEELVPIAHIDRRTSVELEQRLKEELHRAPEQSASQNQTMIELNTRLVGLTSALVVFGVLAIAATIWAAII